MAHAARCASAGVRPDGRRVAHARASGRSWPRRRLHSSHVRRCFDRHRRRGGGGHSPQCHAADAIRMLDTGAAVLRGEAAVPHACDEADQLVAAAARNGGPAAVRREPGLRARSCSGWLRLTPRVGALTHLEVRTLQGLPTWGEFTSDEWGGGALFDLGVHPLAVALLLSPTRRARAAGGSVALSCAAALGHGSDEHAEVSLRYASGFTATSRPAGRPGRSRCGTRRWPGEFRRGARRVAAGAVARAQRRRSGTARGRRRPIPALDQLGYNEQLRALRTTPPPGASR
jgi:hypothetical protein